MQIVDQYYLRRTRRVIPWIHWWQRNTDYKYMDRVSKVLKVKAHERYDEWTPKGKITHTAVIFSPALRCICISLVIRAPNAALAFQEIGIAILMVKWDCRCNYIAYKRDPLENILVLRSSVAHFELPSVSRRVICRSLMYHCMVPLVGTPEKWKWFGHKVKKAWDQLEVIVIQYVYRPWNKPQEAFYAESWRQLATASRDLHRDAQDLVI